MCEEGGEIHHWPGVAMELGGGKALGGTAKISLCVLEKNVRMIVDHARTLKAL